MKICALTMVYQDHWALSQWYRHHGALFGHNNLFVIAHGQDDEIMRICPDASVITIPRDNLAWFDRRRTNMLNAFQAGLLQSYDWVIRTDADELICFDPNLYGSAKDAFLDNADQAALHALGFDLVELVNDLPSSDENVFAYRKNAAFSGHYSKGFAVSKPLGLVLHGVQVAPRMLNKFPFTMPKGVYLAHLKYANLNAVSSANLIRESIASSETNGVPGDLWRNAYAETERFLKGTREKKLVSWKLADEAAYSALAHDPVRIEKRSVIKARSLKFHTRTQLPDWFSVQ